MTHEINPTRLDKIRKDLDSMEKSDVLDWNFHVKAYEVKALVDALDTARDALQTVADLATSAQKANNLALDQAKERTNILKEDRDTWKSEALKLESALDHIRVEHKPSMWIKYNIPCFDEYDSPTAVIHGCTCGSEQYPCKTLKTLAPVGKGA